MLFWPMKKSNLVCYTRDASKQMAHHDPVSEFGGYMCNLSHFPLRSIPTSLKSLPRHLLEKMGDHPARYVHELTNGKVTIPGQTSAPPSDAVSERKHKRHAAGCDALSLSLLGAVTSPKSRATQLTGIEIIEAYRTTDCTPEIV